MRRNNIHLLLDFTGVRREGDEEVRKVATKYFEELFLSQGIERIDDAWRGVQGRVIEGMNECVRANYTTEEVKVALSQMHPIKASNPDRMCPLFYQTNWHIVVPTVCHLILCILRGESSLVE